MILYYNSKPFKRNLNAILKAVKKNHNQNLTKLLNYATTATTRKADLIGIDSLRFITTANFINKLKRKFGIITISHKPTQKEKKRLIFDNFDNLTADINSLQTAKITNKITLQIYHTQSTNLKARKSKKGLNSVFMLNLHGLMQYNTKGAIIRHKKLIDNTFTYILKNATATKTRKNITLKSFDLAFDFYENEIINPNYAKSCFEFIGDLKGDYQNEKGTLYIQKQHRPLKYPLQKIVIYNKTLKSKAKDKAPFKNAINRFEFRFYQKTTRGG